MVRSIGVLLTLGSAWLCGNLSAQTVTPASSGARWVAVGDSSGDRLSIAGALGDITGDGFPELHAFRPFQFGPSESFILDGSSGSVLNPPGPQLYAIRAAGDANADGFADMLWWDYGAGLFRVLAGPNLTTTLHSYPLTFDFFGVGDLNADGCDDHAVRTAGAGSTLTIYSGCTGSVLHQLGPGGLPQIRAAGDLNGDGYADLLVGSVPFSGRDGSVPAGVLSPVPGASPIGDVDGDGIRDFIGNDRVFSGSSGAVLQDFFQSGYALYGGAGDIDGDGHEDLWGYVFGSPQQWVADPCVASPLVNVNVTGATVISGQSGSPILTVYPHTVLGTFPGANYVRTASMAVATLDDSRSGSPSVYFFDPNTDISLCGPIGPSGTQVGMAGVIDLVVPGTPPTWGDRGPSCAGSNNAYPHASLQGRPALTETIAWRLWGALPGASCALQFGTPTAIDLSTLLGPGCELLVNPYFSAPAIVDLDGFATSNPVTIPLDPGLVGYPVSAQWFVMDGPANPLGLSASDALDLVVGI